MPRYVTLNNVKNGTPKLDVVASNSVSTAPARSNATVVRVMPPSNLTNGSFESDYDAWTQIGHQGHCQRSGYETTTARKAVASSSGQAAHGVLSPGVSPLCQTHVRTIDSRTDVSFQSKARPMWLQGTVTGTTRHGSCAFLNECLRPCPSQGIREQHERMSAGIALALWRT